MSYILEHTIYIWDIELQKLEHISKKHECFCINCKKDVESIEVDAIKTTFFSVRDLIKKSAKQLCYIRKNDVKPVVTSKQIEGNQSALEKSNSELLEMRGIHKAYSNNSLGLILSSIALMK